MKHLLAILCCWILVTNLLAQIPNPTDHFGFELGADYKIADYDQMLDYYEKVAASTDRVQMIEIGKSSMGRPIKLLFISDAENMKDLEKWRTISEKLARAKISEQEALELSKEGRAIVWFDGGMHATERAHAQMTPELLYRIASEESDEMRQIRKNVVTLLVPVINPDGLDIVVDWYRKNLGTPYETTSPPVLYQKYVGHDNNRDWFMNNMVETRVITELLYNQWYPQIVHNHHQSSPPWARIFLPPFRSPVNQRIHPGVTTAVNLVGTAMANRFAMKKMPGVISGVSYSMFWNGGMRTAPYFHNQIGILTEVAHTSPTPTNYPPEKLPKMVAGKSTDGTEIFYPYPWQGGESHFRDAIDYMLTSSMAVLDLAAEKKEEFLINIYKMGRDAIEDTRGSFAYIIPQEQWNKSEAYNLVNVMLYGGIEVQQATEDFSINGKEYTKGAFILYGAQSFRPYLEDLMERQNYPDQFLYPGGPPKRPYDLAGWTLPMQMGVGVDRVNSPFSVSTQPVENKVKMTDGEIMGSGSYGYMLSAKDNLSALVINRLQKKGMKVYRFENPMTVGNIQYTAGAFLIRGKRLATEIGRLAKETGLEFQAVNSAPKGERHELKKLKIGIYKPWRASMDEGWTRWMLEQFEYDLDTLHNQQFFTNDLANYSTIILPSESMKTLIEGYKEGSMPEKYVGGLGEKGVVLLKEYIEGGGTVVFFDKATAIPIQKWNIPLSNVLTNLKPADFFIPGSLIRTNIAVDNPLGYSMEKEVAASFSRSQAFEVDRQRDSEVEVVATYASSDILMSGWALGEDEHLSGKVAMAKVTMGQGSCILIGFRPQFRGQSRGTYKLIFNSFYEGARK